MTPPPFRMPCGMRNMFATECSNPSATNMLIGQKMARIFAVTDVVDVAPQMARPTSQLHGIPLKNATLKGSAHFIVAMPVTAAFAAGAAAT